MNPQPQTDELLDQHSAFLRRLAGELTRCEADADDLVQATWTEALARPPQEWSSPQGWLTRVARRLAGKHRRQDHQRTAREMRVARAETWEADLDLSLVLGELSSALGQLAPQLRRVVIARHFQGLELKAIAAAEGVGLTTVKSRLARAYEELRHKLDAQRGRQNWLRALAPLVSTPLGPAPAQPGESPLSPGFPTAVAGALAVTTATKIVASLAVAGFLVVSLGAFDDNETLALQPINAAPHQAALAQDPTIEAIEEQERTPVAAAESEHEQPVSADPSIPEAQMTVIVTDLFGVPAGGIEVLAAPENLPLNSFGRTDQEGRVILRWPCAQPTDLVVGIRAKGAWLAGLRRFRMGPGAQRTLELAVHPDLLPRDHGGLYSLRRVANIQLRLDVLTAELMVMDRAVLGGASQARVPRRPGIPEPQPMGTGRDGVVRFSAHGEQRGASESPQSKLSYFSVVRDATVGSAEPDSSQGILAGVVRDSLGDPVSTVNVELTALAGPNDEVDSSSSEFQRTDELGAFLMRADPGRYRLRVLSRGEPHVEAKVVISAGGTTTWSGILDLGTRLWGQVVQDLPDGQQDSEPVLVSASAPRPGGLWVGVTKPDDDGHFWIPNCPAPTLDLDIVSAAGGVPLLSLEGVSTDQLGAQFPIQSAALAQVSFQPLDSDPGFAAAAELRVWDPAGRRGFSSPVGKRLGESVTIELPLGIWDLEVRPQGVAKLEPISVNLINTEPVDLGPVAMPAVGWLEIPRAAHELHWSIRRGADQISVFEFDSSDEDQTEWYKLPLPAGTYTAIANSPAGGDPATQTVELRASQTQRLETPIEVAPR